jgi:putative NADH-flavin reductase
MPSDKPTVGVAGANGKLGIHVINALISENFRPNFGSVVALVRESAPQYTRDIWQRQGVTVRIYNEKNMTESLAGIDILINAYVRTSALLWKSLKMVSVASAQKSPL